MYSEHSQAGAAHFNNEIRQSDGKAFYKSNYRVQRLIICNGNGGFSASQCIEINIPVSFRRLGIGLSKRRHGLNSKSNPRDIYGGKSCRFTSVSSCQSAFQYSIIMIVPKVCNRGPNCQFVIRNSDLTWSFTSYPALVRRSVEL
jgi:hypothetical protein